MVTGPRTTNPGGFWSVFKTSSWSRCSMNWLGDMLCWTCYSQTRKNCLKRWRSRAALAAMTSHGRQTWREKGPRRVGQSSGTTSLERKSSLLQYAESKASIAEYQHGWRGRSWPSSDAEKQHTEEGSSDGCPEGIQRHCLSVQRRNCKTKALLSWNEQRMWRATRRASCAYVWK